MGEGSFGCLQCIALFAHYYGLQRLYRAVYVTEADRRRSRPDGRRRAFDTGGRPWASNQTYCRRRDERLVARKGRQVATESTLCLGLAACFAFYEVNGVVTLRTSNPTEQSGNLTLITDVAPCCLNSFLTVVVYTLNFHCDSIAPRSKCG